MYTSLISISSLGPWARKQSKNRIQRIRPNEWWRWKERESNQELPLSQSLSFLSFPLSQWLAALGKVISLGDMPKICLINEKISLINGMSQRRKEWKGKWKYLSDNRCFSSDFIFVYSYYLWVIRMEISVGDVVPAVEVSKEKQRKIKVFWLMSF